MQSYRRSSWEEALIGDGVALAIVLGVLLIAAIATVLVATAKESARIWQRSAHYGEGTMRVLKIALLAFLGVLVVSGILLLVPSVAVLGLYLACWSFLFFVLVVEACDWYERRLEGNPERALGDLDTYLDFGPTSNGHIGSESPNGKAEPMSVA